MIKIKNLEVIIERKKILNNININIKDGEKYVILGPSGSGKSVLLKNIIGLMKPTNGDILIDNKSSVNANKKEIQEIRKNCGFLFQHSALFDSMNVQENLEFPLLQHTKFSKKEREKKIKEKLETVGLKGIELKKPSELSGGMQKRVALARSIILEPKYMFYDEPTTGLDPIMARVIDELINDLSDRLGITSVIVTHNMKSAFFVGDRLGLLYNGDIKIEGTNSEMKKLDNPYLIQFIEGEREGPMELNRLE
ncbi:MAG: ABC transporter ATP-binding protein [Fusobacteriota bacterium]